MNKENCKIGMFVSVMQNKSSLPRNRSKIKRIGKIVGVYSNYANLQIFDSDFSDMNNIIIKRKLYRESFMFCKLCEINEENIRYEN